jgi:hypothetical protein
MRLSGAVERDAALLELRRLERDPDSGAAGEAATMAIYCVDEHDADPRMLLAVIRSTLDGSFRPSPGKLGEETTR